MATPSSVHLIRPSSTSTNTGSSKPYSLSRVDLSDLSGSYHHGTATTTTTTTRVSMNLPNMTWQHAKVLSRQRLPQHPQPYHMDDSESCSYGRESSRKSTSLMESADTIEVCLPNISFVAAHNNNNNMNDDDDDDDGMDHPPSRQNRNKLPPHRIPLLLVLMDPQRKLYELLQLWIDTSIDTVRDILQTINKNIADHHHGNNGNVWKQDYDGLFQVRNNHFSPLIHVLPAGKYDIVPGEVWVCQPWSMTSQQTVAYASTLLNHLKQQQILQYKKCSDFGPIWNQWKLFRHAGPANNNNKLDDTVLVLSRKATQRLYVPGGILKHYHACQFLSFSPPLEEVAAVPTKTSTTTTTMNDESQSTASGMSDSRCDDNDEEDDLLLQDHWDDTDDDPLVTLDTDDDDTDMEPTGKKNRSSSSNDHLNVKNVTHLLQQTCSTVTVEENDDDDDNNIATVSPLLPENDRGHGRTTTATTSNATVCSAKTKESTYMFRTYDEHKHSKSIWKTSSNTNHHHDRYGSSSNNRPIPHVLPSGSFGAFRDRTNVSTSASSSSSSFQRMMRRLYRTVFSCRQESMLNRRSRSYDEQLYYTNSSMNMNRTDSNNNNGKYSNWKQRKSSGTTTRTTLLSDDASMGTTTLHHHHPPNHHHLHNPPWRCDTDTASHCSGVPLLLTAAPPTADWVTHI